MQRRAGLATLVATTAAGHQRYEVQDVEVGEALRIVEAAVPGLLAPFLEEAPAYRRLSRYRHGDSNPGFRRERAAS